MFGFISRAYEIFIGKTERKLKKRGIVGSDFYTGPASYDLKYGAFLKIGNNVRVSLGCRFILQDDSVKNSLGYSKVRKVELGDDIFIGANCIILPGTTIGSHVIIGAGTVVRGSIPDNAVVSGNPCKIVGRTDRVLALHKDALSRMTILDKPINELSDIDREKLVVKLDKGFAYEP